MLQLQSRLPDRYTLASPEEIDEWIAAAKATLGSKLLILGHHYQRPEVIKWADARGDSFKLARFAADDDHATDIVFCGVHFMAESADILNGDHQRVVLPDLNAGCSMADMADLDQVEECWESLSGVTDGEVIVHPECAHEVVELADRVGSTERILEWVGAAPPGSVLGVGTEIHMVQRMAEDHPDKTVVSLDPLICPCSTMFRIDGPHLAWCLESL